MTNLEKLNSLDRDNYATSLAKIIYSNAVQLVNNPPSESIYQKYVDEIKRWLGEEYIAKITFPNFEHRINHFNEG